MASESVDISAEISRRHKAVVTTILGLIVAAALLAVLAYVGREHFRQRANPPLEMGLMILVLFLGLGSIAWRRTKFAAMRLQDIGGLSGQLGVLQTLEKTTIQIALFGALIAGLAFVGTLLTGNDWLTYRGMAVALVVLLYSYPTKSSWTRAVQFYGNPGASEQKGS